eukprot:GEMP01015193.1.p1 GENE.GEMP01015193.1~~GEMP01015193.1.p1  ORF type:complete len:621 (-),score=122.47 GEMP01015193.1:894-2756(-)
MRRWGKPHMRSTRLEKPNSMQRKEPTGEVDRSGHARGGCEAIVSATNDSSIVSKAACCAQGYFSDPFVRHFVGSSKRRTALINRGYAIRYLAIDWAFEKFLATETQGQVLILGAGFDTLFFRSCEKKRPFLRWVEVDFPEVIRRKRVCVEASGGLLHEYAQDPRYCLVGADLLQRGESTKALAEVLDFSLPTFILAEVVLTYLSTKDADAVLRWVSEVFDRPTMVLYEQIRPFSAFGKVMCRHFDKSGTSICPLYNYPTLAAQEERMRGLGYEVDRCMDLCTFKEHVADEIQRWQSLEFFDEFAEWELQLQHYMLLIAYKYAGKDEVPTAFVDDSVLPIPHIDAKIVPHLGVQRYGFALSSTDEGFIVYGGFGSDDNVSHRRLTTAIRTIDFHTVEECSIDHKFPMFAQLIGSSVYGGRAGPRAVASSGPWSPRWRHGMVRMGNDIIVVGGRDEKRVMGDVWRYVECTDTWNEMPRLPPRCAMALCAIKSTDGSLTAIAFGGLDQHERKIGEAVDVLTGKVYAFPATVGAQAVPYRDGALVVHDDFLTFWTPRRAQTFQIRHSPDYLMINFQLCVLNNHLCLIGGGGNLFSFGTHVNAHMLQIDLDTVNELLGEHAAEGP